MFELFGSVGTLRYSIEPKVGYKLVLRTDRGISDFYYSLIPKAHYVIKPMYKSHISVVRKQTPTKLENWGKYEGRRVEFFYSPIIRNDAVYYWINCFSLELEKIRDELGLDWKGRTKPEGEFNRFFHITIGNLKR